MVFLVAFGVATGQASPARAASHAADNASPSADIDCRSRRLVTADSHSETAPSPPDGLQARFLPNADLFRPLLADMKAPRFSAGWRYESFQPGILADQRTGGSFNAGVVSFGAEFDLVGWHNRHCEGLQVGLFGAVFSQFNLDSVSETLINSDFQVGIPLTWRKGPWSGRLRLYHQSSHLGDEFLVEMPHVLPLYLSFEALDTLVSFGHGWGRVYGGMGVIFHKPAYLDPLYLQAGGEVRATMLQFGRQQRRFLPVAGVDLKSFQSRNWGVTFSAKAGLQMSVDAPVTRRTRVMVAFLQGFIPFGQFFSTERLTSLGLEAQFEF
jgi:hypothetical protein